MVLGGWSIECAKGGYFDTRCEKPIKVQQRLRFANYVEKQLQKHRKVLFNFVVHIIYYLSRTHLGKYIILVYNGVVQRLKM